jgi:selenocysteine lyase/cysteine desulfurase
MNEKIIYFKKQFQYSANQLHLNNAGQAPLSSPAYKAILDWADIFRNQGAFSYDLALPAVEEARKCLSRFLNCREDEFAFFQSPAWSISQIAFGFPFQSGDEIIIWEQEYPSNFYPWREAARRSGAKLIVLSTPDDFSTPLEEIQSHITPRTRLIATSWVQFKSGAQTDLQELSRLARAKGIFTCIDVIQGVGHLPFDFKASGVDAACGGAHKWLAAGHGGGFLCLRSEHLDKIKCLALGARSFASPGDKTTFSDALEPSAQRFEPGSKPFIEIMSLWKSVELFAQTGMNLIAEEAHRLTMKLKEALEAKNYKIHSPHGPEFKGAILNFYPSDQSKFKSVEALSAALLKAQVSHSIRLPGIRISPHAFNTDEEIERLIDFL